MKQYFVYILKCVDNSYYTGVTNNLERRLYEHTNVRSVNSYTAERLPIELVFHHVFHSPMQAISFEKQVKGWSRKKKEALINDKWELLPVLAECKNESHFKNRGFDSAQPDESSDDNHRDFDSAQSDDKNDQPTSGIRSFITKKI